MSQHSVLSQVMANTVEYVQGALPIAATAVAKDWDSLWDFLIWLSVFFFILVVGGMIYFAVVYRKGGRAGNTTAIKNHTLLEIVWTAIPTALLMLIFVWGWIVYKEMISPPTGAMEVKVLAKKWNWAFQYENGRTSTDLVVPVGKPVRLIMTSQDVLHSFFVPNFRVKSDVVPGRYTYVWFEAKIPGTHQIYCTEYCGTSHSQMLAQVVALEETEWKRFERGGEVIAANIPRAGIASRGGPAVGEPVAQADPKIASMTPAQRGEKLSQSKGCIACHTADGDKRIGPTYKGLYDSMVELADGTKVKADESYLRSSIENPTAQVVKGFAPSMPTFKGQLTEQELGDLIAYIKSVK